jgi:hypothetical protein
VVASGAAEDVASQTWVQVTRGCPASPGIWGVAGDGCSRLPAGGRSADATELEMENLGIAAAVTALPLQAEVILLRSWPGWPREV